MLRSRLGSIYSLRKSTVNLCFEGKYVFIERPWKARIAAPSGD